MSQINKIPAGYRFSFKSWENDRDSENTLIVEGISEKEAYLLSDLAKIIQAKETGLENKYNPSEKDKENAYNVLWPIFERHENLFDHEDMEYFCGDVGLMVDYINENILGHASSRNCWMRVLESYKIELIPEEIQIKDVTDTFNQ